MPISSPSDKDLCDDGAELVVGTATSVEVVLAGALLVVLVKNVDNTALLVVKILLVIDVNPSDVAVVDSVLEEVLESATSSASTPGTPTACASEAQSTFYPESSVSQPCIRLNG